MSVAPQVAYKETIRKSAEVDNKYARQSGGKGQYGHVKIKVEPNESGKGYEFCQRRLSAARSRKNISPLLTLVSRAQCRPAYWPGILLLTVR